MARYLMQGQITISVYRYIEADDPAAAVAAARGGSAKLCPEGPSRRGVNPCEDWVAEDADGEVVGVKVDRIAGKEADEHFDEFYGEEEDGDPDDGDDIDDDIEDDEE